jgi:hypothetical protein
VKSSAHSFSRETDLRRQAATRVRRVLLTRSSPRLHMFVIILLTGMVGMLSSRAMLSMGMESMVLRWPAAMAVSYAAFIVFVWAWLAARRNDDSFTAELATDVGINIGPDLAHAAVRSLSHGMPPFPSTGASRATSDLEAAEDVTSGIGKALGSADEGGIPFVIAIIIGALAASILAVSAHVIAIAPGLLAEVLLDGALAGILLKQIDPKRHTHWLTTLLSKTWWMAAGLAMVLMLAGTVVTSYAPGARTLSEAHTSILNARQVSGDR